MISKTDIIKMTRTVFKRSQGYRKHEVMHPSREWFIGIGLLIVVVVVGGVINALEYRSYNTLEQATKGAPLSINKYSHVLAQKARDRYEGKMQKFDTLSDEVPAAPVVPDIVGGSATSTASTTPDAEVTPEDLVSEEETAETATTTNEVIEGEGTATDVPQS